MATSLSTQLHTIAVSGRTDRRSICLLMLSQPTAAQQDMGRFFTLFELEGAKPQTIERYSDLARFLAEYFYEEYAAERNHFEDTIMHANALLKHFSDEEDLSIHALVGLFENEKISFSSHGSPDVWLFSEKSRQVHRLSQERQDEESFFGELVEGSLSLQDVILFASSHVRDYYTQDRLAKIVHGHNGAEIARHLQRSISQLGSGLSFASLLAEARPISTPKKDRPSNAGSHASIETLLRGQDVTDELLEPTVLRNARVWLSAQWRARPGATKKSPQTPQRGMPRQEESLLFGHSIVYLLKSGGILLTRVAQSSMIVLWRTGRIMAAFIKSSPTSRVSASNALKQSMGGRVGGVKNTFRSLPQKRQALYVTVGALLIIGTVSASIFGWNNHVKKRDAAFNKETNSVAQMLEESNAAIIYGAHAQAQQLLAQAQDQLHNIKPKGPDQKMKHEELHGRVATALIALRKEIPINFTQLNEFDKQQESAGHTLSPWKDLLLITRGSDSTYATSSLDGTLGVFKKSDAPLLGGMPYQDDILYLSDQQLVRFDGQSISKLITLPELTDFALFADRIYALYAQANRIDTHRKSGNSFSQAGSPWLQNAVLFPLHTSFIMVDGSLYLVGEGGSIVKLQKGQTVPFTLTPVDPAIEKLVAVWTSDESNHLYFLEPDAKRLLAYNKEGALAAQYTSDAFEGSTDFTINESTKTAYVISDTQLFSFPLSHIK